MARFRAAAAATAAFVVLVPALVLALHGPASPQRGLAPQAAQPLAAQPLAFEPNAGRFQGAGDFLVRDRRAVLAVDATRSVLSVGDRGSLTTRLVAASDRAPQTDRRLHGVVNWYAGPRKTWRTGLPTFAGVRYANVLPGIDLAYHGRHGRLEYDFVVAPHAGAGRIGLVLTGATSLRLTAGGDLLATVGGRTITQRRPVAYQAIDGARHSVRAGFVLRGNRVSFAVGDYDHARALVIDPVVTYSDYVGGTGSDTITGVALDSSGNAYLAGSSSSPSLPGAGGTNPDTSNGAGFAMKIAPGGARSWITYLGWQMKGVTVDQSGNVLVTGITLNGLAVKNAAQPTFGGGTSMVDAFAGKLNPDGTPNWVTYLGGGGADAGLAIAADGAGDAYVAGQTTSPGLATGGAFQTLINGDGNANGPYDGLLAKYSPNGAKLFATYLGGSSTDQIEGVGVAPGCSSSCEFFVAGGTASTNFPVSVGADDGSLSGSNDAFMFKFTATGGRAWGTYYGGTGYEEAHALAMSHAGSPAMVGVTAGDGFLTTYNASTGSRIDPAVASFGGSGSDTPYGVAFDAQGNAYIVGSTMSSTGFNTAAVQPSFGGQQDAFAVKFKPGNVFPVWSTYLGGFDFDAGYGVATDASGGVWIGGSTSSTDYPVTAPTQSNSTPGDGFVTKLQVRTPAITSGPSGTVHGHDAAFTYGSGETGGTFQCELSPTEARFTPCSTGGANYSSLADGDYTFQVESVDPGGTPGQPATQAFSIDTHPHAAFTIAPNPVLAGRSASFDASTSTGGDSAITDYAWDLDGNGSYERDTGTTAKTGEAFPKAGTIAIGLRIATASGAVAVTTQNLQVSAATGPAQFGVTINNGAQYTRTPDVTVSSSFPASTTDLLFSNDGGFLKPESFPAAKTIKWKLDSSGPERLPKIVYVRFLNGPIVSETHTDDIILDETPPKVDSAAVAPDAAASPSGVASTARLKRWKLKVKAHDSNSGVAKIQATSNKRKPGPALKYKRKLTVKSAKRPRWIRARDRAGNWSKWKRAR